MPDPGSAGDAVECPVGVIDIGSNSVRLVVYDRLSRAPTQLFNEKALCGLGRGVAVTRRLPADGVEAAFAALRRFRVLCDVMHVRDLHVLATAAARFAENGPAFMAEVETILQQPATLLSGQDEARLAALGVMSGMHKPDGIVGDLGGGSLEIIDVKNERAGEGISLPLGGLALRDAAGRSHKRAARIVHDAMVAAEPLLQHHGRDLYAIGGTWRALGRMHMRQIGYPLNVLHGYSASAADMVEFCRTVMRVEPASLPAIHEVAAERRPLLAYGAQVLEALLLAAKARRVIISAAGVREGLLYSLLASAERKSDPLLAAARELARVRARSPEHGQELTAWCERFITSSSFRENAEEKRLRRAACLLADISWRAHPDYRGEQSLNVIAHATLPGIDHAGRAFLALAVYYRYEGVMDMERDPRIREFMSSRLVERARVLGAAMRLSYAIGAAMPGILPMTPLTCVDRQLVLNLPGTLKALASERLMSRLRHVAKLLGLDAVIAIV